MWHRVEVVLTDVSEERIASIFRVEGIKENPHAKRPSETLKADCEFVVTVGSVKWRCVGGSSWHSRNCRYYFHFVPPHFSSISTFISVPLIARLKMSEFCMDISH
jgi:hypothetical protein